MSASQSTILQAVASDAGEALEARSASDHPQSTTTAGGRTPGQRATHEEVTLVVPCYNEREALPNLFEKLEVAQDSLGNRYSVHILFVDDCSTDGTFDALCQAATDRPHHRVVRHHRNRGVAAAVLTGLRHASSEIVCCVDADCSYDPSNVWQMIERLTDDVQLVTASPYHPQGKVDGVPRFRVGVSKGASNIYRLLARNKLHTYTSCFRVYRKSAYADAELRFSRFAGIAELLWHIDASGGKIVEFPTTLSTRQAGHSKLRLLPAITDHVRLMSRCAWQRMSGRTSKTGIRIATETTP